MSLGLLRASLLGLNSGEKRDDCDWEHFVQLKQGRV